LPLFPTLEAPRDLELVELQRFPKGVVAHVFQRTTVRGTL
jgi:hypothetical protein